MPADNVGPSVTELLLVVVFLLGLCVLFLAAITDATAGYDTTLGLLGRLVGSLTAVGALALLFLRRRVDTR